MLVGVAYQFHDYELKLYVIDTERLRENHVFEAALRAVLEQPELDYAMMNGNRYHDDFGDVRNAVATPPGPYLIDHLCNVVVDFENSEDE